MNMETKTEPTKDMAAVEKYRLEQKKKAAHERNVWNMRQAKNNASHIMSQAYLKMTPEELPEKLIKDTVRITKILFLAYVQLEEDMPEEEL
jgi:hypothetical protein